MANLFIAMGGSGLKTVREIREKHREGDYFLFIDTDTNDLVDAKGNPFSERETVDLAKINVMSYLQTAASNNEVRRKADTWLDPNARATMKNGPLEKGASANRPQGRLAIASIAGDFKKKIKLIIKSIDDIHKNDNDKLQTFIVLSVAGGTGSSIYLDLTQILYDELYAKKGHDFSKPTAVLYMPDVFVGFQEGENVDRYKTNVFAFWKELDAVQRDYFGSINQALITSNDTNVANEAAIRDTNFSNFAIIADKHNQGRVPFQPFNSAILIDHENMSGQATDIKQRYKDVARLLEMISVRTHGGTIKSALDNTILPNSVTSLTNKLPWVKQYWSAGYSEIRSGREFFDEYVKTNLKRVVYENFIGINGASKDNIDLEVRPLFQDNFLAYIESDKFNGFDNKAKEVDGKPLNLSLLKEKYWKDYLESNIDTVYSDGIETKDESSAEGLKRLFDRDIKDKTPSKLIEFILQSGFQTDSITTKILNEFYDGGTEIALSQGLTRLSYVYEALDTRIDDLSMLYDSEIKALSDLKSTVIIESQEIINRNLADTVITQYATIKEGPAWNERKKQWYEAELTNLKNLIKAYYDYQANELLLKLKKEICDKISFGQSNNIQVRGNLTKVINSLTAEIDDKIKPNAHKHLVNKYLSYKNNALTTIIPNIANFADGFDDSNKNIFKRIFETECGIATGIKDGKPFFIHQTAAKTDLNSKSIEDLIRITFNENKFVLNNMQNGSESASKFLENLDKLIETKLISNLNSILTKGQSADNTSTGYPKYISYTLEDWINVDTDSFNSIKSKFDKRASVFCNLINVSPAKDVWLSSEQLKKRIDDIFTADGDKNIPTYAHQVTTEDVIICIKYLDNLSFDNYNKFIQYKDHYRVCLTKNINTYFPHIDVRFKNAMKNFLHDVENQTPLLNVLSQGSTEPKSDSSTKSNIDAINYLTDYSNFYFLAKFYEKLNNADKNIIYKNLVMSDGAFSDIITGQGRNGMFNPPVFIDGNRIKFFSSNELNKLQNKGIIWLSGNVILENNIELTNVDTLSNDFQKVIMLGESSPSSWSFLQTNNSLAQTNMECIKKRYAITNDKTLFKSVLTETIKEVKEDIMKLMLTEEDYKNVFNTFYVKYSNELNKLIM